MIIILKIFVFIVSLALVALIDWSAEKDKSKNEAKYKFWRDYWPVRNNNVIVLLVKSFLTGIISFFASAQALEIWFPEIENMVTTDTAIELILIIAFTVGSGKIFHKFNI